MEYKGMHSLLFSERLIDEDRNNIKGDEVLS